MKRNTTDIGIKFRDDRSNLVDNTDTIFADNLYAGKKICLNLPVPRNRDNPFTFLKIFIADIDTVFAVNFNNTLCCHKSNHIITRNRLTAFSIGIGNIAHAGNNNLILFGGHTFLFLLLPGFLEIILNFTGFVSGRFCSRLFLSGACYTLYDLFTVDLLTGKSTEKICRGLNAVSLNLPDDIIISKKLFGAGKHFSHMPRPFSI